MGKKELILEYFVPIQSSAELNGDFTINGIAINETTTSNGHKFIAEELSKAASTMIGIPLLKDHENSVDSIVGKVNRAHFDEVDRNIQFNAVIKDSKMIQLIKDKLLSTVSVGADVRPEDIEETEDGDIIPHNIKIRELSLVAVPADGGATFSAALRNAYKLHSTKVDNTIIAREDKMTEEEKTTTPEPETKEEPKEEVETKEESTEEPKEKTEEEVIDAKIKKLEIKAKKKKLKALEEEEEESDEDEVEEMGDYKFAEGMERGSFGIQRKSYIY